MTQPRSLTDKQRDVLLNELRETAPDVVIVAAVHNSRIYHKQAAELEQVPYGRELYKLPTNAGTVPPASEPAPAPTPSERPNVNPGKPAIGKIGSNTREWILSELKTADRKAEQFGAKFSDHLKLLWSRGEIKFDGERYYV